MKQQKRKGFTLVELLVVIAILAILATVSIVGYTQFLKKANISNDTALVTQINNLLVANDAANAGKKSATMQDALQVLVDNGFSVQRFTPTAENHHYVWDSQENQFLFLNEKLQVVAPSGAKFEKSARYYAVAHNEKDITDTWAGCSIYLADDFGGTTLNVTAGVDVGNIKNIETINYTSATAEEVTIRTNSLSTKLTVEAPNASVVHYGKVNEVLVKAVAASSYHEHGKVVGRITLNSGRVVVENGSEVESIAIDAEAAKIASGAVVIAVSNKTSNSVPVIVDTAVKDAIKAAGGKNGIEVNEQSIVDASGVVAIGSQGYASFDEALANVKDGDTIILLQDVEFSDKITGQKSFTINMNNHNIKTTGIDIENAHVAFVGNGMIMSSDQLSNYANALVYIVGSANESDIDYTNVKFGAGIKFKTKNNNSDVAGAEVSKKGCFAYGVVNTAKSRGITVSYAGEILDGWGAAINGTITNTVNAPTFIYEEGAKSTGIYGAGYANWIINGGTFSGEVEFCAGNIVINGGDFLANGEKSIDPTKQSEACTTGYSLAIVGRKGYAKVVTCTINGGNFSTEIVAINQIPEDHTCILTINNIGENKGLLNSESTYVVPQGMSVTEYSK